MSDIPFLGIDFGTTNSVMAWWNPKTRAPEVLKNSEGSELTPSVVFFPPEGGEPTVGKAAVSELRDCEGRSEEDRVLVLGRLFRSIKRSIAAKTRHALPPCFSTVVSPVEIASHIFAKLKKDAENLYFHEPVTAAVVTYPAAFGPLEREAIRQAAEKAGFTAIEMLEEPVAAALGCAETGTKVGRGTLVYDLGGGTFDLAFVEHTRDANYRLPIAPMGHPSIGGDNFDQAIYQHWEREFQAKFGRPIGSISVDQADLAKCRESKEDLSSPSRTKSRLTRFRAPAHSIEIDRTTLENLIGNLVEETVTQTKRMLDKVHQAENIVDTVLLIGGSTRIPLVQQRLVANLPVEPVQTGHADVAVALGAAVKGRAAFSQVTENRHDDGDSLEDQLCPNLGPDSKQLLTAKSEPDQRTGQTLSDHGISATLLLQLRNYISQQNMKQ